MIQFMYKLLIYVGHLSPVISIVAPRSKYCGNLHYLLQYYRFFSIRVYKCRNLFGSEVHM